MSIEALRAEARSLAAREERVILARDPQLAAALPPASYAALAARRWPAVYSFPPPELSMAAAAVARSGPDLIAAYHRFALATLLADADLDSGRLVVPASLAPLVIEHFRRILEEIAEGNDASFVLDNDTYLKDLAIVSLRLLPIGSIFLEELPRLPLSLLAGGGPAQLLRGLWFLAVRVGGLGPIAFAHLNPRAQARMTVDLWELTHHRAAELFAANPRLLALAGESWLVDPQIETISPHLAFIRRLTTDNGGASFFVRRDQHSDQLATMKSATRRRLFESGQYRPEVHLRLWPRRALIAWSTATPHPD